MSIAKRMKTLLICAGLCVTVLGLLNGVKEMRDYDTTHGITMKSIFTDPTMRPDFSHPAYASTVELFGGVALMLSTLFIKMREPEIN